MAENKQEKKTIQVGDQKYLVDDILGLSAAQLNNYFNFARDKGGYDDEGIASLRNYINKRLDNIKAGQGFNADGSFDWDVVENVTMKVKKPGGFGKKEITQGNRDWANNYFYHLVKNLKPYQETEDKPSSPTWDISKHGLDAYLTGQGLDAKHVFENYDLKDTNNPDAARSFKQRRELLKQHLGGYRDWLKSKGFDFTKNDNEWDDNYLTDFESFVNNFDTLDNNALTTALRKYGAGNYTTAFTSDKWDLTKTNADLEAEADAKAKEAEAKKKAEYMKSAQDTFLNAYTPENGFYLQNTIDYSNHDFGEGVTPSFMKYYADLNEKERSKLGTYLGTDSSAWDNAYQTLMDSLRTGTEYTDANKGIILQRYFEDAPNGFTDVGNGLYLINESVNDMGQVYVYDPKSRYLQKRHISEFANQNDNIKREYERLLYDHINKTYGTSYDNRTYVSFEQGGILKAQLGAAVLKPYNVDTPHAEKAKANGIDTETQKAKNQYMDSDNKSEANPNAGWDTKHFIRLGSAVADLTAAVAGFVPGGGTAYAGFAGVGSTLANFGVDMFDDAVTSGEMWKNLGLNLGMDALGLIPGGGAASKMGKIVKTLKSTVPLIVALPGVVSLFANSPEIAASWKKAFDGDSDEGGSKMDYQDYMNILQVLNVAAGATNIARNTYQSAKRSTKQSNKLAVDVVEAGTTNRKALVLEGDDVTKFREANAKGEAQKFVDELEGPGKYTINEVTESNKGKFWGRDANDKFEWFHQNPLGKSITGKANTLELKWDTKNKMLYAETGKWDADLGRNKGELVDVSANRKSRYEAEMGRLQGDLDAVTGKMKESMAARTKRTNQVKSELAPAKVRLVELQAKLKGVPDAAALQTNKTQLEADLATLESQITTRQQAVATAEADLQRLLGDPNTASNNEAIKSARGKVQGHKTTLQGYESAKQRHLTGIADIDQQLQTQSELPIAQARVSRLEGILENLNLSKHTRAYNKLQQMVADYKTNHSTIAGRTVNWDMEAILRNAGIRDAFKQGGNINKSKINKFLKYAKG